LFIGLADKGESEMRWHAEVGFGDAVTVELGVIWTF